MYINIKIKKINITLQNMENHFEIKSIDQYHIKTEILCHTYLIKMFIS